MGFYLPPLKWNAPKGSSFSLICDALERAIKANPALAAKHKWPSDRRAIEDWVDLYNATVCARMGWSEYIQADTGGITIPKSSAPHQQQTLQSLRNAVAEAKELVSGAKTLDEYLESNEPPVSPELSTHRAIICSKCPLNSPEDLTKWFTVPAAEYIRRKIGKAQSRNMTTPRDDELNLCTACHCPLKLKVHIPIEWIGKRLGNDKLAKMRKGKDCWIIAEMERK